MRAGRPCVSLLWGAAFCCQWAMADDATPLYGTAYRFYVDAQDAPSTIRVENAQGSEVARYEQPRCQSCDDADDPECGRVGSFSIQLNQSPEKPLLGTLCFTGVHSQVLYIYSPLDDAEQPVATFFADFVLDLRVDPYGLTVVTDRVEGPDQVNKIEQRWPESASAFSAPAVEHISSEPTVKGPVLGALRHSLLGHDSKSLYRFLAPRIATYQGWLTRDQLISRWGLTQPPESMKSEFWPAVYALLNQPVAVTGASERRAVWPWYSALALERPALAIGWHFAAGPTVLRAGPSQAAPRLEQVEHLALRQLDDVANTVSRLDGWYLVESPEGVRGYVSSDQAPPLFERVVVAERDREGWLLTGLYLDE